MNTSKNNFIIIIMIFAILLILLLGMFSYIMISPIWYDENAYITPGVLIQNNTLYQDFAYLQMPYLPILYGIVYKLTETSYYLFTAELINFVFMTLSAILVYFITYKISNNNILVALSMLLLFVLNRIIVATMRYSANAIMPIPFSLMGFYLFISSVSEKHINRLGVFLSGISLAVATGTKLYYAAMLPPFFFISLFYPRSLIFKKRIIKILLPVMAGVIVGLLPAFYYLIKDFDVFIFNNLGYHLTNTTYREITGYTRTMSTVSKILYAWKILASPTNVALLIGSFFIILILLNEKQSLKAGLKRFLQMESVLCILLVTLTTITAFTPTPLWDHYFALPLPFVIILITCWYNAVTTKNKPVVQLLLICLMLVCLGFGGKQLFKYVNQIHDTSKWAGISVHTTAQQIRHYIGTVEKNDKIATLYPLYAIEAGLPIYNEFSAGSFVYRLGDLIPENKRNAYVCTSPATLRNLLDRNPPKAILVGWLPQKVDEPFIKYAKENNYVMIQKNFNGMILYVREEK